MATDHGFTGPRNSTARVEVNIKDVNDNAPNFTMVPYTKKVQVNTPQNRLILTVKAIDADSAPNNLVEYTLASNTSADSLSVRGIDFYPRQAKISQ